MLRLQGGDAATCLSLLRSLPLSLDEPGHASATHVPRIVIGSYVTLGNEARASGIYMPCLLSADIGTVVAVHKATRRYRVATRRMDCCWVRMDDVQLAAASDVAEDDRNTHKRYMMSETHTKIVDIIVQKIVGGIMTMCVALPFFLCYCLCCRAKRKSD